MKIISNDIFFLHNKNYSVEYIGENDVNNLLNKLLYKNVVIQIIFSTHLYRAMTV